jgi:hypothetical protein
VKKHDSEFGRRPRWLVATAVLILALLAGGLWLVLPAQRPGDRPATLATDAAAAADAQPLRYDVEYPAVAYSERPRSNRVAALEARLMDGTVELEFRPGRGYLDSLLAALDIDVASQLLVFSKTSLLVRQIGPDRPRAIFFNDDTYVAWVRGAPALEIATMDAERGPVFYNFSQDPTAADSFDRRLGRCLRCHDSYSLSGGGVPRFLLGSGYIDRTGDLVSHEAWIITHPYTPLKSRWGGWYVSGFHGSQVHLGNIVVGDAAELENLEALRIGNRADLEGLVDTAPYPTEYSDIVAHLVIEHQVDVQNAISRARFDAVTALEPGNAAPAADLDARIAAIAEPLVAALLMADDVALTDEIAGTSGFKEEFEARGPFDSAGRSLRELDLNTRVFRYPLSYEIYSAAFDGLPAPVRTRVFERLNAILSGEEESAESGGLAPPNRQAILEILRETKPEFAATARH